MQIPANRANPPLMATRLNLAAIMKVAPNDAFHWLFTNYSAKHHGRAAILLGLALVMRLKRVQNQLFCGKALKFFCLVNNDSFLTVIN